MEVTSFIHGHVILQSRSRPSTKGTRHDAEYEVFAVFRTHERLAGAPDVRDRSIVDVMIIPLLVDDSLLSV